MEGEVDFGGGFAYAGEHYAVDCFRRCGKNALQFAAGDDVEACAVGGKQLEDGEGAVGLDGVADEVFPARECALKKAETLDHLIAGVDIKRGAVTLGESFERDFAAGE